MTSRKIPRAPRGLCSCVVSGGRLGMVLWRHFGSHRSLRGQQWFVATVLERNAVSGRNFLVWSRGIIAISHVTYHVTFWHSKVRANMAANENKWWSHIIVRLEVSTFWISNYYSKLQIVWYIFYVLLALLSFVNPSAWLLLRLTHEAIPFKSPLILWSSSASLSSASALHLYHTGSVTPLLTFNIVCLLTSGQVSVEHQRKVELTIEFAMCTGAHVQLRSSFLWIPGQCAVFSHT